MGSVVVKASPYNYLQDLPGACSLPCCQDYVMLATKVNDPDAPPDDTSKVNLLPLRKADI